MYMFCDYWFKEGVLDNINVEFYNMGVVFFGVKEYVFVFMEYIKKYYVNFNFEY